MEKKGSEYAPVVLFVYNRSEHVKKTLERLNILEEAPKTDLFIFSDAPKNEKSIADVKKVREEILHFKEECSVFKSVKIIKQNENKGLANSIISGVTKIINVYGYVIVLEDDLIVADDFLSYMNEALKFYQDSENIWAISGYTFPLKAFREYKGDVYLSGRGCSWGWATWKNRWETVDWQVLDYPKFKFNYKERKAFAQWGKDLPAMLDAYMYGEIQSWAIRWCYSAFRQNKYTVYPVLSRVVNEGTDGSGTNFSKVENRYDTILTKSKHSCTFFMPKVEKKIKKEFSNKYLKWDEKLKLYIRWMLIRLGILSAHKR